MRALDRKLLRDAWRLKGQGLAIAAVIGVGVAMFVAYLSTLESLSRAQQVYYAEQRFADVFASLTRAPSSLGAAIARVPGVVMAETRVVLPAILDLQGFEEPVTAQLVSLAGPGGSTLNRLVLVAGRLPEPARDDEAVVNEGFALAHALRPGARLGALINGRWKRLTVVGIGLSPEYIYAIKPGLLIADDARYAIVWMPRDALEAAGDFAGAFNDVALTLAPGRDPRPVLEALDRLLAPYGGRGAVPRALQMSHWSLVNEFAQLRGFGTVVPAIFLGVATFLLHVVLGRIVATQREQIAALKALGYSNAAVGLHFGKWSAVIGVVGTLAGWLGGIWMGTGLTEVYRDYFRFPSLVFQPSAGVMLAALAVSVGAALLGALGAVRHAVSLPPAEAMRPMAPATYRRSVLEVIGLQRWLTPGMRMVARHIERSPIRSATSIVGIGLAAATMVIGLFMYDAIDALLFQEFTLVQRHDLNVTFTEPRTASALHELRRLPGVLAVEPILTVPVRIRAGHRSRQIAIVALPADPQLRRVVAASGVPVAAPATGVMLATKLAELLGVGAGDVVDIEELDGRRATHAVRVTRVVDETLGLSAYMSLDTLYRLRREGPTASGANLDVDPRVAPQLYRALQLRPSVAGVTVTRAALETMRATMDETVGVMILFNVLFSGVVGFGVVFNAVRVSLSEQSRELASLRVLGFTRREVARILFGELVALCVIGIPLGLVFGYGLALVVSLAFQTELYRIPVHVTTRTFAVAALVTVGAAALSALIVRRTLDRLDMVGVLKARD